MPIQVVKGGRIDLTKDTGLKEAMLGLGWKVKKKRRTSCRLRSCHVPM